MNVATITLVVLAASLWLYAWQRNDGSQRRGLQQGWLTLRRTMPLLLVAFAIIGYVDVLSPQELVQTWLGPNSGWPGILLAEGVGLLLPGGPYVVFPLIAVLYRTGAGLGPAVTLALISVSFELPFMGWRFTAVRWGLGLLVPLVAGGLVQLLFGG